MSATPAEESTTGPVTYLYLVIGHPTAPQVLVLREGHGWSLPRVTWPGGDLRDVAPIQAAVRRELNLQAVVLRCLDRRDQGATGSPEAIFALEALDEAWQPPDTMRWAGRVELVGLARPEQRRAAESVLNDVDGTPAPQPRPPWSYPGWYAQAVRWITEHLERSSSGQIGVVEQMRSYDLSCVLRVGMSGGGVVYFKALPPVSAAEPAITRMLATLCPGHVPEPLRIDDARHWMLLPDCGPLMDNADMGQWEAAVTLLAGVQQTSSDHVATLLSLGAFDLRLEALESEIEAIAGDPRVLAVLDGGERRRLRSVATRLQTLCHELAGYAVPPTLLHADMHTGNIAVREGRLCIFDWSEASISHPFFDLASLLDEDYYPPDVPHAGDRLRRLYLAQWTAYEPPERLAAALALAEPLSLILPVASYRRLLPAQGAIWRRFSDDYARYWLRTLLRHPALAA